MNLDAMPILDAATLAFWTRAIREASHWSQDALAEASGLTVRTIQRIEAGERCSITSRRALARGLGYENPDIFLDPQFAKTLYDLLKDLKEIRRDAVERQFPDVVRLPAMRIRSGEQLGRLAESTTAHHFHYDEDIPPQAKECAAAIFDYLRDYGDVGELYSEIDKLVVYRELNALLEELETHCTAIHSATRSSKIIGKNWPDQTPMRVDIGYLVVVTDDKMIEEIAAPKNIRFGS